MPELTKNGGSNLASATVAEQDYHAEQRGNLAASLETIAAEVMVALQGAGVDIPVFFSIPGSGTALMTFGTLSHPDEEDWIRASEIICPIVSRMLGMEKLYSRPLACIAAGSAVGAADLVLSGGGAAPSA